MAIHFPIVFTNWCRGSPNQNRRPTTLTIISCECCPPPDSTRHLLVNLENRAELFELLSSLSDFGIVTCPFWNRIEILRTYGKTMFWGLLMHFYPTIFLRRGRQQTLQKDGVSRWTSHFKRSLSGKRKVLISGWG